MDSCIGCPSCIAYTDYIGQHIRCGNTKCEILRLYFGMTPSMQKAILDIMKTQNGLEIDNESN